LDGCAIKLENPTGFCALELANVEEGGGGGAEGCVVPDPIFGYIYYFRIFYFASIVMHETLIYVCLQSFCFSSCALNQHAAVYLVI